MLNCWNVMQCGLEIGGSNVDEYGVCPAADATNYDGVNGGQCAGRFCWAVSKTLCHGDVQGTLVEKALSCMECEFYKLVVNESRDGLIVNPSQLAG